MSTISIKNPHLYPQSPLPAPTSAAVLIVLFPSQISSFVLLLPSALLLDLVFSFPSLSAVLVYSEGQDPCKKALTNHFAEHLKLTQYCTSKKFFLLKKVKII